MTVHKLLVANNILNARKIIHVNLRVIHLTQIFLNIFVSRKGFFLFSNII